MEAFMAFKVKFWGARGSRSVPGKNTLIYGGNTSCVEVRCQDHLIILDAGSGICELMEEIIGQRSPVYADIMISHMHWDHIIGLPFFKPLYNNRNIFCIHGTNGQPYNFETALKNIMRDPNFPVSFDDLKSYNHIVTHIPGEIFNLQDAWHTLQAKNVLQGGTVIPDVTVTTHANQHPNGGTFFKLSYEGKSICYASDTECHPDKPEFIESLINYAADCELLIMDTNYTRDEYEGRVGGFSKKGWGHASWQDGVEVAKRARVKKLCLFHHNAERTDSEQAIIEKMAQAEFAGAIAAKEGMEILI
jgi:phosphoribosyl 1,2-cyclic phosphodiesterase